MEPYDNRSGILSGCIQQIAILISKNYSTCASNHRALRRPQTGRQHIGFKIPESIFTIFNKHLSHWFSSTGFHELVRIKTFKAVMRCKGSRHS
jgi:hypothetical protein